MMLLYSAVPKRRIVLLVSAMLIASWQLGLDRDGTIDIEAWMMMGLLYPRSCHVSVLRYPSLQMIASASCTAGIDGSTKPDAAAVAVAVGTAAAASSCPGSSRGQVCPERPSSGWKYYRPRRCLVPHRCYPILKLLPDTPFFHRHRHVRYRSWI